MDNQKRLLTRITLSILILLPAALLADDAIIATFKGALSSPPDVRHFAGTLLNLQEVKLPGAPPGTAIKNELQRFEGARAGSNYYLLKIRSAPTNSAAPKAAVVGRNDKQDYHVNKDAVTYVSQSDSDRSKYPLTSLSDGYYTIACQFLNMGFGDFKRGSVKWVGNSFTAERKEGQAAFGDLVLSNGLPAMVKVRKQKGDVPERVCHYEYPDPPGALSGFPRKITMLSMVAGRLKPIIALTLSDVQVSEESLASSFFNAGQFATNVAKVRVFTNDALFEVRADGSLFKLQDIKNPNASWNSRIRTGALIFVLILTAGLLWFFRLNRKVKQK
jgi:hypothetical protein